MKLKRFVLWWWRKSDMVDRTLVCYLLSFGIPGIISIFWFGQLSVLFLLVSALAILACWGTYGIYFIIRNSWKKFNETEIKEREEIIRRLKTGINQN